MHLNCLGDTHMLDVKLLREDLARVKERLATRGTEIEWDEFVSLDRERRDALAESGEDSRKKRIGLSGEIGKVKKSGGDAALLMQEVEEVSEAIRKPARNHWPRSKPVSKNSC